MLLKMTRKLTKRGPEIHSKSIKIDSGPQGFPSAALLASKDDPKLPKFAPQGPKMDAPGLPNANFGHRKLAHPLRTFPETGGGRQFLQQVAATFVFLRCGRLQVFFRTIFWFEPGRVELEKQAFGEGILWILLTFSAFLWWRRDPFP